MHLDLQPLNLLVIDNMESYTKEGEQLDSQQSDGNGEDEDKTNKRFIHLTNFCISSGFQRKKFSSNLITSLYFMAPERICGEVDVENDFLMAKADVWSVGVLLFILVFGKPPFDGKLTTSLVKSIKKGNVKLKDNQWDDNLQLFVHFITDMLQVSPTDRISVVDAIHHEFFARDYSVLKQLSFKRKSLHSLEEFWNSALLKNEIKNFAQFMASCVYPSSMIERIFEEKTAQNIKQVLNGMSYITEDLTIARYIFDIGFPEQFNDQSNQDPQCAEEHKINAGNVCNHFLSVY